MSLSCENKIKYDDLVLVFSVTKQRLELETCMDLRSMFRRRSHILDPKPLIARILHFFFCLFFIKFYMASVGVNRFVRLLCISLIWGKIF